MTTKNENRDYCRRIADELEAYAEGQYFRCDCGAGGTLKAFQKQADETECHCFECGEDWEIDDLTELSVYDYMEDVLDFTFVVDSRLDYRSVSVAVSLGGPNIYIDTDSRSVELYWGGDRESYSLRSNVVNAVDEYFEEVYNSLR